ncbi:MAG: amidohydrolase family protein, partial [Firmicutes bacterium]|nr:amidohydrolase family protein [Bacillota bacterium]
MSDNKAIRNAKVWTADKSNPWAECIVVRDNKIAFAGTYNDAEEFIDEKTEVIDAGGKMIIPSFIDSHTHTSMLIRSSWLEPFDFEGCQTMDEVMKMVADYIGNRTPEEFPYVYADPVPTELIEKEHADKHIVDKYVSDRPVLLSDTSFHQCIANSKMLELMEITKDTPYNEESAANYLRDEKGEPNGVILERLHEFNGDIQKMYEKIGWEPPR